MIDSDSKKQSFKIEVVPDAFTIGLFKKTLVTRKRLRITTAVALVGLWLLFMFMSWFLRGVSGWPTLNVILLIALMGGVVFTSYLLALTIGVKIFPGPWRDRMRRGDKFVPHDIDEQAALLKNKSIYFILLWFGCILITLFGCDFASGRVVTWYSNVGGALAALRSDDAADRRASLNALSNPLRMTAWKDDGIREELVRCFSDSDPEVAALAQYVAGRAFTLPDKTDADQNNAPSAQNDDGSLILKAADRLIANLKNDALDEHVRAEAATTLGRIGWIKARPALLATLNAEFAANPTRRELLPAIIYAFTELRDKAAVYPVIEILEKCLTTACSEELTRYAFFYLKMEEASQGAKVAFDYIDAPNQTDTVKCYAASSLRFTAEPGMIADLKLRFDRTPVNLKCEDTFRKYHKEASILLFEHDQMRALYIRAVGNHMRNADYDWIYAIGSDTSEPAETRKVAEIYTRAMNEKKLK